MQVGSVPVGSTSVFSFWVGIDYDVQVELLRLCSTCDSIDGIAVFRDRKWTNPQAGIYFSVFIQSDSYKFFDSSQPVV